MIVYSVTYLHSTQSSAPAPPEKAGFLTGRLVLGDSKVKCVGSRVRTRLPVPGFP